METVNVPLSLTPAPFQFSDVTQAWEAIAPTVQEYCNASHGSRTPERCKFVLEATKEKHQGPNAKTWIGPDGSARIAVNSALLASFQNTNEIAFVLAHEAAHTIADHHNPLGRRNLSVGFTMRHDHKLIELEADVIGTAISAKAGFDPMEGARILSRLVGLDFSKSKTHPKIEKRLAVVARTAQAIRQGHSVEVD